MTRDEEQKIIAMVLEGDRDVFEELVRDNQDKVYNLALRMTGNEEDAFDLAQETFLRAFRALGSFRGDCRFSVWLYRLTYNISIDFIRKKKKRENSSLTYHDDDGETAEIEIPDLRFNPETLAERRELQETINRGLARLPPDYRRILTLREIDGLSYEEIGFILGLEDGTVKSRIFRARKRLCALLAEEGNILGGGPSNRARGV